MAVTGASSDEGDGARVVANVRDVSDIPVYVGIGITTPQQAAHIATVSDGVIVGSALVKVILDGASAHDVEIFVRSSRQQMPFSLVKPHLTAVFASRHDFFCERCHMIDGNSPTMLVRGGV